ncbi:Lipopolysaccharide-modifying protein [Drechmeria coniospora]|uniref:Lipopolysaccharide-modifying protein n=1 Tax=Drechmeria coniospora TaxID=98403 RepID=A0A151GUK2_DRECN|nr:Lipopolysaccharide-modifying protein [Drechmeria coniospora]KYK60789.1 Lipopolysaccharide-modifying protein [Drechmeria coniospora]
MGKILTPRPFPRRSFGLFRYALFVALMILMLYTLKQSRSSLPVYPDTDRNRLAVADPPPQPGTQTAVTKPDEPATPPDAVQDAKPVDVPPPQREAEQRQWRGRIDKTKLSNKAPPHAIDKLIYDAQHHFAGLLSKRSKTVSQAAQAYRKQRNRHPPPGFDKWFEFAQSQGAVIVEDFFDQIYHDLEPFWGLDPALMRREASQSDMTINIRNGTASTGSDWFWTKIWHNMIKEIESHLPDMDVAINPMDEPRLVVPWEDVDGYMAKAALSKRLPKPNTVVSEFENLPEPKTGHLAGDVSDKAWEDTKPYWHLVRRGCAPSSLARTTPEQDSFVDPPEISTKHAEAHMYKGYVSNYTLSNDLCHQPDLQGLEGILIEPLSVSTTKVMFPMFGGSKLMVNNEILLPPAMYWNEEERFTGGDDHGVSWGEKQDVAIWRGVATGGKNRESNWRGFQRHRFISMANGTKVAQVESGEARPENFVLPDPQYNVRPQSEQRLGKWIDEWSDMAFIDLSCETPQDGKCNYTDFYFQIVPGLKMAEQFSSKFLPDIDGNSFSGRYLGFLRSTSLPIKATIWREWHDSRLVPWKHFVPMDNRYSDFYGIMEYFLGYQGTGSHDAAAEKIATEGKEWAEQVLRKEDMLIYVMRLLLEYARVLDPRRETMGWVGDVIKDPLLEKTWLSWWWFRGN